MTDNKTRRRMFTIHDVNLLRLVESQQRFQDLPWVAGQLKDIRRRLAMEVDSYSNPYGNGAEGGERSDHEGSRGRRIEK